MLGHAEPARALAKKWSVSRQENVEASLDTPHLYRSLHYTWLLARNNDCIYATEHISRKSQEFSPRLTWRAQAAAAGSSGWQEAYGAAAPNLDFFARESWRDLR